MSRSKVSNKVQAKKLTDGPRTLLATGTLSKLPGNNPVQPGGKQATTFPDNTNPQLISPVYAYTGDQPTQTGTVVGGGSPHPSSVPIAPASSSAPAAPSTSTVSQPAPSSPASTSTAQASPTSTVNVPPPSTTSSAVHPLTTTTSTGITFPTFSLPSISIPSFSLPHINNGAGSSPTSVAGNYGGTAAAKPGPSTSAVAAAASSPTTPTASSSGGKGGHSSSCPAKHKRAKRAKRSLFVEDLEIRDSEAPVVDGSAHRSRRRFMNHHHTN